MSTSGTYTFNPSIGELVLFAYDNIQIRRTSLLAEHMTSARTAINLILSRWSNQGVNLWAVDLVTTPVTQGTATYPVDANTVMILDAYMGTTSDPTTETDKIILPVSRSEYASYPQKWQQGATTVYWFDRLLSPTVTLWPVPDGATYSVLKYYRVRRLQDADLPDGQTAEVPYLWLDALADALAFRLSRIYKPELAGGLKALADESYAIAAAQNVENAAMHINPGIIGYWRN